MIDIEKFVDEWKARADVDEYEPYSLADLARAGIAQALQDVITEIEKERIALGITQQELGERAGLAYARDIIQKHLDKHAKKG